MALLVTYYPFHSQDSFVSSIADAAKTNTNSVAGFTLLILIAKSFMGSLHDAYETEASLYARET